VADPRDEDVKDVGVVTGSGDVVQGPDALFCIKLVDGMQAMFIGQHRGLGAKGPRMGKSFGQLWRGLMT